MKHSRTSNKSKNRLCKLLAFLVIAVVGEYITVSEKGSGKNAPTEGANYSTSLPASSTEMPSERIVLKDDRNPPQNDLVKVINPEVIATRGMVAAHAPLRDPELADPNSLENQKILQTMILKGLSNIDSEISVNNPSFSTKNN